MKYDYNFISICNDNIDTSYDPIYPKTSTIGNKSASFHACSIGRYQVRKKGNMTNS